MKLNKVLGTFLIAFFIPLTGIQASRVVTIDQLLGAYPAMSSALVEDKLEESQAAAKALAQFASTWLTDNPDSPLKDKVQKMKVGAGTVFSSEDLDEARIAFITLSQATIEIIREDVELQKKWQLFFCPMVAKKQGYWVQPKGEEIANPYMGTTMPTCGGTKPW